MFRQVLSRGITTSGKQNEDSKRDISAVSYNELKRATNNFAESNKIGSGGYGKVYRGNLDGKEVAVKMPHTPGDANQVKAFCQEVDILSKLHHRHLVCLVGACPEKFAIIYEFMPGGTLEDQLVQKDLLWEDRLRIATEICDALVYLHSPNPDVVVHGDVKPENILLDGSGRSKLGDFGICRLMPLSKTTTTIHHTTKVKGSSGYLDPAFDQSGRLAPSADVYSFGMVMLRLLAKGQPGHRLIENVQDALEEQHLENILDFAAEWPYNVAEEFSKVALKCCNYRVKRRPDLAEVWQTLENLKDEYFIGKLLHLEQQHATSNFSSSNNLGEVVFGRMYREKLSGRKVIAMLLGFCNASSAEAFRKICLLLLSLYFVSHFLLILEELVVKVLPHWLAFPMLSAVILSRIFMERGPSTKKSAVSSEEGCFSMEQQLQYVFSCAEVMEFYSQKEKEKKNYDDQDDRVTIKSVAGVVRRVQSDCGGKKSSLYGYEYDVGGGSSNNIHSKCNPMNTNREMDPYEVQDTSEEFTR